MSVEDVRECSTMAIESSIGPRGREGMVGCRLLGDAFQIQKQIGEGTYGDVFLALDKDTRETVALKKLKMQYMKEGFPLTILRELNQLQELKFPNILTLKEVVRDGNNVDDAAIYMVLEYMDHDLIGLAQRMKWNFSVPQIKCLMKQMVKGIYFMHKKGVVHRDLKTANILLDKKGNLKIADFGLSRKIRDFGDDDKAEGYMSPTVITLWYRPPELLMQCTRYGPEVDIWSLGCIFAELLTGKALFPGTNEQDQLQWICRIMGSPTDDNWPGVSKLKLFYLCPQQTKANKLRQQLQQNNKNCDIGDKAYDLLQKMLQMDPSRRASAEEILRHEYFWDEPGPCDPVQLCANVTSSHHWQMLAEQNNNNNTNTNNRRPRHHDYDNQQQQGTKRPRLDCNQNNEFRRPDASHRTNRFQQGGRNFQNGGASFGGGGGMQHLQQRQGGGNQGFNNRPGGDRRGYGNHGRNQGGYQRNQQQSQQQYQGGGGRYGGK
eukprot:TRINITY_DN47588_c0_g2_i3.p2 TRINITY_DN47588_c0_g2~~TRINITY_DN47588_c0_g2_i3.p2  ORF type:complete len:490 (-),score=78.10 TRINITY_DN47588_c0_g2_i3:411-1880(-)